ncbi:MAG: phenylalanine--tRNA ligase subunit alpha [Euryarchaeota archaeon]|nr:phenylalanine--tRNA ligase subunit alpha [Euryarchaeota archaeon]
MLSLHEKRVLLALENNKEETIKKISEKTEMDEVAIMRASLWLSSKKMVEIKEEIEKTATITEEGKELSKRLPERKILENAGGGIFLEELDLKSGTVLGWLRKRGWAKIRKKNGKNYLEITEKGKNFLDKKTEDEKILKIMRKKRVPLQEISKETLRILKSRKAIKIKEKRKRSLILTERGIKRIKEGITLKKELSQLTPEIITKKSWGDVDFKRFNIKTDVRTIYPGKKHFVNQALEYVRSIWIEMGFKEMTGPIVDTQFWVFDALFQPQDHPARDMQDTFFLKDPEEAPLPSKDLVERVKKMHEDGITEGWGYTWDERIAKKLILRTHTTSLSARTLAGLDKGDIPAKFFSVGKVFRNETLDWNHLAEFYQTDGIVIDKTATFRQLLGYLKRYLVKMGFSKFRFRPAYFPYTEPSVEAEVFHPKKKEWVELFGAGIFRPEVVVPLLGEDIPVLAWGPGPGRIIREYWDIVDLRDLYKNDLKQLRELKLFLRG